MKSIIVAIVMASVPFSAFAGERTGDCSDLNRPILVPNSDGVVTPLYTNTSKWCRKTAVTEDQVFASQGADGVSASSDSEGGEGSGGEGSAE
jgi:hypothetical protein